MITFRVVSILTLDSNIPLLKCSGIPGVFFETSISFDDVDSDST